MAKQGRDGTFYVGRPHPDPRRTVLSTLGKNAVTRRSLNEAERAPQAASTTAQQVKLLEVPA